jgi:hypothetical protein
MTALDGLARVLRAHPELAVILTLAVGFALGKLRVGSFTLGTVLGCLLAGVAIGLLAGPSALAQESLEKEQAHEAAREFSAGRFLTATKTVVLAVEHETPLNPVAARGTAFLVGAMLTCFFTW